MILKIGCAKIGTAYLRIWPVRPTPRDNEHQPANIRLFVLLS